MIRKFERGDLDRVMQIWLNTNLEAHDFVREEYWKGNYEAVKEMLLQAEIYVYEDENAHKVQGFIGLVENYIGGIFVESGARSRGIGGQLLRYVKEFKTCLTLEVYQKNERAVRFYQREAFLIQSEEIEPDTGEKEYCMCWKRQHEI